MKSRAAVWWVALAASLIFACSDDDRAFVEGTLTLVGGRAPGRLPSAGEVHLIEPGDGVRVVGVPRSGNFRMEVPRNSYSVIAFRGDPKNVTEMEEFRCDGPQGADLQDGGTVELHFECMIR